MPVENADADSPFKIVVEAQIPMAAAVNTMDNFEFVFNRRIDGLFVDRMDHNEEFAERFLNDQEFKKTITGIMVRKVYEQIREELGVEG